MNFNIEKLDEFLKNIRNNSDKNKLIDKYIDEKILNLTFPFPLKYSNLKSKKNTDYKFNIKKI